MTFKVVSRADIAAGIAARIEARKNREPKPAKPEPLPEPREPLLEDFAPARDPLVNLPDTGSVQKTALVELEAVQTAFYERRNSEKHRSITQFDTEYWFAVIFEDRDQKEHFLQALGIIQHGDKYVDGRILAECLSIELPASDVRYDLRPGNVTKRN
jgi:hypothetical protein